MLLVVPLGVVTVIAVAEDDDDGGDGDGAAAVAIHLLNEVRTEVHIRIPPNSANFLTRRNGWRAPSAIAVIAVLGAVIIHPQMLGNRILLTNLPNP